MQAIVFDDFGGLEVLDAVRSLEFVKNAWYVSLPLLPPEEHEE